jgi:energy-coupling factor transport system permease protein
MVFLEYLPGNSIFHRLDVRTKVCWLAAVLILSFIFNDPLFMLAIMGSVVFIALRIGLPFSRLRSMFQPLVPVMICIVLFTGFGFQQDYFVRDTSRRVLLEILGLQITVGGVMIGVTFLVRLIIIVVSTSIVTLTTRFEDFIALMKKLHFPYALILAVSISFRFIPTLMKELETVIDAQQARGLDLEKGSFLQKIKKRIPLMIPMLVGGIRHSENLAIAILVRGFGASKNRASLYDIKMSRVDYTALALILIIMLIGVYIRFTGLGIL